MAKQDDSLKGLVSQLKAEKSSVENALSNQGKELNAARKAAAKVPGLKDEVEALGELLDAREAEIGRLEAELASLKAREDKVSQDLADIEALRRLVK